MRVKILDFSASKSHPQDVIKHSSNHCVGADASASMALLSRDHNASWDIFNETSGSVQERVYAIIGQEDVFCQE